MCAMNFIEESESHTENVICLPHKNATALYLQPHNSDAMCIQKCNVHIKNVRVFLFFFFRVIAPTEECPKRLAIKWAGLGKLLLLMAKK